MGDFGRLGEILRREEVRKGSVDSRRGSSSDDEISSNCESERSKNSHKSSGGDSGLSKTNSAETVGTMPRKSLLNDRNSSDSVCKQSSKCSSVDSLDLLEKSGNYNNLTNSSIFTDEGVVSMTP